MPWHDILFLVLYGCLTLTLILLKVFKVGNRRRGVIKIVTVVAFVGAGIYGCCKTGGGLSVILAIGLLFAGIGDVMLVFMDEVKCFVIGIYAFGCASLLMSVYSVLNFGWQWWSALILFFLVLANVLCQKTKIYNFGKIKVHLNIYTILVSVCGSLGISLVFQGAATLPTILFGLGCFMYLASDVCLGLYMFRFRNRAVDAVNTLLYFPAMLLIALSLIV